MSVRARQRTATSHKAGHSEGRGKEEAEERVKKERKQ